MRYYLLFSFVIVGMLKSIAQELADSENHDQYLAHNLNYSVKAGIYNASPQRGSYISESTSLLGLEFGVEALYKDSWIIGIGYNRFKLEDHNLNITGYYDDTSVSTFHLIAGYQYKLNGSFFLSSEYHGGLATYKHDLIDSPEDFDDSGFHNELQLKFKYSPVSWLDLGIFAGYRFDILNVDTPEEIADLYDNTQFITSGFSLRLKFN
jgi:hypothetical protein